MAGHDDRQWGNGLSAWMVWISRASIAATGSLAAQADAANQA
jgi:hypothetical protein